MCLETRGYNEGIESEKQARKYCDPYAPQKTDNQKNQSNACRKCKNINETRSIDQRECFSNTFAVLRYVIYLVSNVRTVPRYIGVKIVLIQEVRLNYRVHTKFARVVKVVIYKVNDKVLILILRFLLIRAVERIERDAVGQF